MGQWLNWPGRPDQLDLYQIADGVFIFPLRKHFVVGLAQLKDNVTNLASVLI